MVSALDMTKDPTSERLVALIDRLDALTRSGKVRWEQSDDDDRDDSFEYATPSGSVVIGTRDKDGRDPYVLFVRDAVGRLAERADLRWNSTDRDADLYPMVGRLYRIVRRQVLRTDDIIDGMLRDLE